MKLPKNWPRDELLRLAKSRLKELESKIVKIYELENTTKESQIKDEKQVQYLTSSVDYITKKFDEYEEEREKRKSSKLYVYKSVCFFWKTKMVK